MTQDRKAETAIEMCLPLEVSRRVAALMAAPSDDFVALVRAAGLDPESSFRGKVLRVDFGTADLAGFDFSGADLSGCDLSSAKLDGAIFTGARRGAGPRFLDLQGHEGWVRSVAFSPDGSRIASGGGDGILRLWNASSGVAMCDAMRGHKERVCSVAFSPDSSRIVSGGGDGTLRVWDASTGAAIGDPLRGHEGRVRRVAFSPDGNRIVSGGDDGTLRFWDAATGAALGKPLRGQEGQVTSITFSPDGTRIVSGSGKTLRLRNAFTGALLGKPLHGHMGEVKDVAFSPDGNRIISGGSDRTLRFWDAITGAALGERLRGHRNIVTSVAYSPDGGRIVSGSKNGGLLIWILDPPARKVFISTRPETEAYARFLMRKLLAHPEMAQRHVVEAVLDPVKNPRPEHGARDAIETSDAVIFVIGEKGLAFMQNGELEVARRLQRKTGRPRIMPVVVNSAIPTETPDGLKGYHLVHMPLDKPAAFDSLVEAICQAVDSPVATPTSQQESYNAEQATAEQVVVSRSWWKFEGGVISG